MALLGIILVCLNVLILLEVIEANKKRIFIATFFYFSLLISNFDTNKVSFCMIWSSTLLFNKTIINWFIKLLACWGSIGKFVSSERRRWPGLNFLFYFTNILGTFKTHIEWNKKLLTLKNWTGYNFAKTFNITLNFWHGVAPMLCGGERTCFYILKLLILSSSS